MKVCVGMEKYVGSKPHKAVFILMAKQWVSA